MFINTMKIIIIIASLLMTSILFFHAVEYFIKFMFYLSWWE